MPDKQKDNQKSQLSTSSDEAQSLVPRDPLIGRPMHEDYELLSVVGTGAWGRVYRARFLPKNEEIALKALHLHLQTDEQIVLRFQREARSGFSVKHSNICDVFAQGVLQSGQPFIAMELLHGENLGSRLRQDSVLPVKEAIEIFSGCAAGLKAAHAQGIVHRDIKPANIFLVNKSAELQVKLLDFGMAKILAESNDFTQTGPGFGTLHYMSPEQVRGDAIDSTTDIYSLGCVMYEALTGRKVFLGPSAYQIMENHLHKMPEKLNGADSGLNIPEKLEAIIMQTLSKQARSRMSAQELLDQLSSI